MAAVKPVVGKRQIGDPHIRIIGDPNTRVIGDPNLIGDPDAFVAIDPLAVILPASAYLIWVQKHPHEPKVADIRRALRGMTPRERKDTLARARTLVELGRAVEEALAP
jgi:hypothetical protein